jgi:hypothetical protein
MKICQVETSRAAFASRHDKTFPLVKNKSKDECRVALEPLVTPSATKSRKQSRMKWEGVGKLIQTDAVGPTKSSPEDETKDKAKLSVPRKEKKLLSPQFCSKCADELKPTTFATELELHAETEQTPESSPRPGLRHTCTSCASPICQQCFPSRKASAISSPLYTCLWAVPDQESRRSTRNTLYVGPSPYPEDPDEPQELVGLPTIDHGVEVVAKDRELSKERSVSIEGVKEIAMDYTNQTPIPDPMKWPSLSNLKLKQSQSRPKHAQFSTSSRAKPLPQISQPSTIINQPIQLADLTSNSSLDTLVVRPGKITDKQVYKGLHVATAAACDEDVDKWIEEITGYGIRKFLADLSCFEGLGVNTLADVARRAARQRKEKLRAWEIGREARVPQKASDTFSGASVGDLGETCVGGGEQVDWVVGEMSVVASDGVEEKLVCKIVHARDCLRSEGGGRAGC